MLFNILHLIIVISLFVLILIKVDLNVFTYIIVVTLLSNQLYILYVENTHIQGREPFAITDDTSNGLKFPKVNPIKIDEYEALIEKTPIVIKTHINDGIQDLIDSSKSKDEYSTLYERHDSYKDAEKRKQYKHVDYLLEKLKLADKDFYAAVVPDFTDKQYEKMKEEDDKAMETKDDDE